MTIVFWYYTMYCVGIAFVISCIIIIHTAMFRSSLYLALAVLNNELLFSENNIELNPLHLHTTSDVDVARLLLLCTTSAVQTWETLSPSISNTSITALTALTPNAPFPPFCSRRALITTYPHCKCSSLYLLF